MATFFHVAGRLLAMTTALDPALRLEELRPLDEIYREQMIVNNLGTLALGAVTLCVLLLSAAGLYALMSFTVNQRRREIGIRSAMGAQPHRLLAGIFRRALGQVAAGGYLRCPGGAPARLLLAHGRAGRLERPGCRPGGGGTHDWDRPAGDGRPGPSWPPGRSHRGTAKRLAPRSLSNDIGTAGAIGEMELRHADNY